MHAIRATAAFDGTRFVPGGATLLLEADRIVGVEPHDAELPDDVEVTSYAGTVLPGLVDCHTHLVADATWGGLERAGGMTDDALDAVIRDSLRAHAAAGVTTVRDLGDRGYRTLRFRDVPGLPRVVAAGPPITTPAGHCWFLGGAVADDDVRGAVLDRADRGVDVIKVMASGGFATPGTDQMGAQFTGAELATLVEAAHDVGLPVVAHAHSLVGMRGALAAGVDGIEHFTGLAPGALWIEDSFLEEVARLGVRVDLTLGNDRGQGAPPAPPPPVAELLARAGFRDFQDFYANQVALAGRLRDHGVAVICGVDSGMGPAKRHGNAWRAVGDLVEAGFPVEEALAAATSAAADACGLAGVTGSLAPGLAADVLVVDGDLATDPAALATPLAVLVRGLPPALV